MAEAIARKYRAFLSYSHRDTAWAKWLHRALEAYRIDKDLAGRETAQGPVPKTLRPIFRDRDDFSAGHSLTEQTLAALDVSEFLIVLCSPNAAQSRYVNDEIRHFKALGRATHVINVIVGGDPGNPQKNCFPPAARYKVDAGGEITDEQEEPLAADARPHGDGKRIAVEKVVAGLLGIGLDEIMRRAERARKRRLVVRIGSGIAGAVVLAISAWGWWGVNYFYGQLLSSKDINSAHDAADICERTIGFDVADVWRITLALKCIQTFSEVLADLPRDTQLPQSVAASFQANVALLQKFEDEHKLTPEQSDALSKAKIFADQIGQQ